MARHRRLRHLLVLHVSEGRTARIVANQIPSLPPLATTLHGQALVKLQVFLVTTAQADQMRQKRVHLERTQTRVHLLVAQAALETRTLEAMRRLAAKNALKGINPGQDTPNAIFHLQASLLSSQRDILINRLAKIWSKKSTNLQASLLGSQLVNQPHCPLVNR